MNPGYYTERRDLQYPCKDCHDRVPGCSGSCQNPRYHEVKRVRAELKKAQEMELSDRRYDWQSMMRRSRKK